MKMFYVGLLGLFSLSAQACPEFMDHSYRKLHSTDSVNLCSQPAKAWLLVNTASHCGFTPQFKGLEAVYQRFKDQGLVVVGFASDDFKQEDDSEEKAADICYLNYGVTFTMLAPTAVRGDDVNPTFKVLAEKSDKPAWNFNKYLVSADGQQVQQFGSRTKPDDAAFNRAIEQLLNPAQ